MLSSVSRGRSGVLTYREMMTAVGELYGTTYFATALLGDLYSFRAHRPECLVVITDVRFPEEWRLLSLAGAAHIKVSGVASGPFTDHESENHKLHADAVILGKGCATLAETEKQIVETMWRLLGIKCNQRED